MGDQLAEAVAARVVKQSLGDAITGNIDPGALAATVARGVMRSVLQDLEAEGIASRVVAVARDEAAAVAMQGGTSQPVDDAGQRELVKVREELDAMKAQYKKEADRADGLERELAQKEQEKKATPPPPDTAPPPPDTAKKKKKGDGSGLRIRIPHKHVANLSRWHQNSPALEGREASQGRFRTYRIGPRLRQASSGQGKRRQR